MTGMRNLRPAGPCVFLLLLGVLLAAGCSTSNENSGLNLVDSQGRHPAGWLAAFPGPSLHSRTATFAFIDDGTTNCTECHGDALNGGISKVSCLTSSCHHDAAATNWAAPTVHGAAAKKAPGSSSFFSCQICHGKGFDGGLSGVTCFDCHGDVHPHPEPPWLIVGATDNTHTNTDPSNAAVCAACHFPGSPNNPPGFPATPAPTGTPPGCFNNTLCHAGAAGTNHPVPFFASAHFQATTTTFASDCSSCHAFTGTSPNPSAPLCGACHTNTASNPLTTKDCTSCHASPPTGAPGAYPNVAGAHAVHIALNGPGTPISCATCHNGLGSGTLDHYLRAGLVRIPPGAVALIATYNAANIATVPFLFDNTALTCRSVSCHGGQANVNWQTGTLDPNTQCTSCHAFNSGQFNEPASGEHGINNDHSVCTNCHNTTTLAAAHFTNLATSAMEGPASATIGGGTTQIPAGNYNAATGSCTPTCHGTRTW